MMYPTCGKDVTIFFSTRTVEANPQNILFQIAEAMISVRVRTALVIFLFQFLIFRYVVAIIDENPFTQEPEMLLTCGALYGNDLRLEDC